jgi:hypothetical protein
MAAGHPPCMWLHLCENLQENIWEISSEIFFFCKIKKEKIAIKTIENNSSNEKL